MREPSRGISASFPWHLRAYFRQVAGLVTIGSIAGIIMNTAVVLPAVLLGHALDVALAVQRQRASTRELALALVALVAGTAASELPRIVKRFWLTVAQARIESNVRSDALRGIFSWPVERLTGTPVGDLMARVIGDVDVLGVGVGELLVETWDSILFSISLLVAMFVLNAELTAISLLPVPVALIFAKVAGARVAARTTLARQAASALSTALHEQLGGVRVLRLFGRTHSATQRVQRVAEERARAELATIVLSQALAAIYTTLLSAGVVMIVWQGGNAVIAGQMTVGGLVAFLQLFARFTGRVPRIATMINRLQASGAAYRRLSSLLIAPPSLRDEPKWSSFHLVRLAGMRPPPPQPQWPGGPVSLRAVELTVSYPGVASPVLTGVNLEIPPGSFVAITGPVGSGKSALARTLAGLWPVAEGQVTLDGRRLETLSATERAAWIGYLAQDPHLFSGNVAENILLAAEMNGNPEITSPLMFAARVASLESDIRAMPQGMNTQIGELGLRVSGGQRQRIALARAVTAPGQLPRLLVLDDPFSAVDIETEVSILAALRGAFGHDSSGERKATIALFSHRLAAFPTADLVVVLDGGRVREVGTHSSLIGAGGLYSRIYRAQARLSSSATDTRPRPP